MLFSGALRGDTRELENLFDGCYSIAAGPGTLEAAMADGKFEESLVSELERLTGLSPSAPASAGSAPTPSS